MGESIMNKRLFETIANIEKDIGYENIDVILDRYELEDILKNAFDNSVYEFYKQLPEEKKLQKNEEYNVNTDIEIPGVDIDLTQSDVEEILSQLDEDIKFQLLDSEKNYNQNFGVECIQIPNLDARYEFEQFYERFSKKWNL